MQHISLSFIFGSGGEILSVFYLMERNCLRDKLSQFSRMFAKFAKLNPREKSTGSQFVRLNPREILFCFVFQN